MRYFKRLGIYKARNVKFYPEALNAYSYGWWRFVAKVDGLVIFNNYRYSSSTSRHQRKVASLLSSLGIKVDIYMPLPNGIQGLPLAELIQLSEEHLCNRISENEIKREERNAKARVRRLTRRLKNHLENEVHFRDYTIADRKLFGKPHSSVANKVAVHQCVDTETLETDVQNAIYNFHRDGFSSIVFYVGQAVSCE